MNYFQNLFYPLSYAISKCQDVWGTQDGVAHGPNTVNCPDVSSVAWGSCPTAYQWDTGSGCCVCNSGSAPPMGCNCGSPSCQAGGAWSCPTKRTQYDLCCNSTYTTPACYNDSMCGFGSFCANIATCQAQCAPLCTYPSHACQNGTSCSQPCNGNTNGEECPGDTCSGGVWEQCQDTDEGWMYVCSSGTPIIIDVTGEGFPLTDAAHGVNFDFFGTGKSVRIAWTAPGSDNAWLVLPNAQGLVESGKNMFGNMTPQPPSKDPNGFLALAVYDLPENGGNGDGIIDARDAIFSKLRLWQDKNHDGISQPNELFTLPQLGVVSISLNYQESSWKDAYGNQFHYKSRIVDAASSKAAQWTYDVVLVIAGEK